MSDRSARSPRLVWRLFAAMTLVVVAGAVTLLVVSLLLAPQVFHSHLGMVQGPISADLQTHIDEAFAQAVLLSLAVGVAVALVAALTVTWLVSRRVADPIVVVAGAAARVAAGDLTARVPTPGLSLELTQLADSFNAMTARLAGTEQMRKRLIGDLAHELRNPLASLQATVEAVADGVVPADATTWTTLAEQTGRLQRLVDDMAAVSRAEERQLDLRLARTDAGQLARDAVNEVQARYDAGGVTLTLRTDPGLRDVTVDRHRMAEVLANLLANSLRHTTSPGGVAVAVRIERESVVIEVADTGEGFDPAYADRIFERFYRGDASRRREQAGSGVGLTIARAIVAAHDGKLTASSKGPGTGATFTVRLPATPHAPRTGGSATSE